MSNEATNWAWSVDGLAPAERLALIAIADYADENWSCFPGQERLAERVCVSKRTIIRLLQALEEKGLIRRERRARPDGTRTSDRFFLRPSANLSPDIHDMAKVTTVSPQEPSEEPSGNTPPTPSAEDTDFEALWTAWPKKAGKQAALRCWRRLSNAKRNEVIPLLVAHANAYRQHTPPQFIPMLSTILNQERWDDPLAVSRERGAYKPEPKPAQGMVIPQGHVPVRNELGQIIGSRPA